MRKEGNVIGTGLSSARRPRDSGVGLASSITRYDEHDATPRTTMQREMEQESEVLESSMERERAIDRGGGMRSTMREGPEYREQKMDAEGFIDRDQDHLQGGDAEGGGGEKKGILSRAKDKLLA